MLIFLAILLIAIGYLSFCFAIVNEKERAILIFLGEPIAILESGLHFYWWPLQWLKKFPTTEQKLSYEPHEAVTRVGIYSGLTAQEEKGIGKDPNNRGQMHGSAKLLIGTVIYFFWPNQQSDPDGSLILRAIRVAPDPHDLEKIKIFFKEAILDAVRIAIGKRTWRECFEDKKELIEEIRRILREEENPFKECGIKEIYVAFEEIKLPEDLEKSLTEPEKARLAALAEENKAKGFATAEKIRTEAKAATELKMAEAKAQAEERQIKIQATKEKEMGTAKAEAARKMGIAEAENKKAMMEAITAKGEDGLLIESLLTLKGMAQGTSNTIFYQLPEEISSLVHNITAGKNPEAMIAGLSAENKKRMLDFLSRFLRIKEQDVEGKWQGTD